MSREGGGFGNGRSRVDPAGREARPTFRISEVPRYGDEPGNRKSRRVRRGNRRGRR